MPARVLVSLVLFAVIAGGMTVLAAQFLGVPLALFGLFAAGATLGIRVWLDRK